MRLDETAEAALALMRNEGMSDSQAVRGALREAGERRRSRASLRAEVARLAADEADRDEMASVRTHLEELAPPT